jgi:hypothetical protein
MRLAFPDRLAIDDLYARFVDVVARRRADELHALFHPDATVEGPLEPPRTGVDAIVATMAAGFTQWEILLLVPQSLLLRGERSPDGDTVHARWYVTEIGRRDGDDVLYSGIYHDVVASAGDAWQFRHRRFDLLYAKTPTGSIVAPMPDSLGPWR